MNEKEIIGVLTSFDTEERWLEFIRAIILELPPKESIRNSLETPEKFLIRIDKILSKNNLDDLRKQYHLILTQYYKNLSYPHQSAQQIALLHWIFSAIKPQTDIIEFTEKQFFREDLIDISYKGQNLHVSLLALLSDFPRSDKEKISHYLISSLQSYFPVALFTVGLRFFLKNFPDLEYFNFLEKLIDKIDRNNDFAALISSSLSESKIYLGSYQPIFNWLESNWSNAVKNAPSKASLLRKQLMRFLKITNTADQFVILIIAKINTEFHPLPFEVITSLLNIDTTKSTINPNSIDDIIITNINSYKRILNTDIQFVEVKKEEIPLYIRDSNYYINKIAKDFYNIPNDLGTKIIPPISSTEDSGRILLDNAVRLKVKIDKTYRKIKRLEELCLE